MTTTTTCALAYLPESRSPTTHVTLEITPEAEGEAVLSRIIPLSCGFHEAGGRVLTFNFLSKPPAFSTLPRFYTSITLYSNGWYQNAFLQIT
jgi:hypothetical protein